MSLETPDPSVGYTYTLPASLDQMPALAAWVEAIVAVLDITAARSFAIQLCLEELVVNVILHAVPPESVPLAIGIRIHPNGPALLVTVEDNGAPFDPTQAPAAEPAPDLPSATIGGRGLLLVGKFATNLRYSRHDGCNAIVLEFAD